jgi:hypothetical protein
VAVFPAPLTPLQWTGAREEGAVVRHWFLSPVHAARARDASALTADERARLKADHDAERWLWKARAPAVLRRTRTDAGTELSLVDLSYSSWAWPDLENARFGATATLADDGRVEIVADG